MLARPWDSLLCEDPILKPSEYSDRRGQKPLALAKKRGRLYFSSPASICDQKERLQQGTPAMLGPIRAALVAGVLYVQARWCWRITGLLVLVPFHSLESATRLTARLLRSSRG